MNFQDINTELMMVYNALKIESNRLLFFLQIHNFTCIKMTNFFHTLAQKQRSLHLNHQKTSTMGEWLEVKWEKGA